MSRLLALAGLLALGTACIPVLEVEARITLPAELMASLTYPVQIAFETDLHRGKSQTMCAAEAQDFTIVLDDETNECAEPIEVRAALGPWTAPMTGCTVDDGNAYSVVAEGALATAVGTAFEDADGSGGLCRGAQDTVDLVLDATADR